MNIIRRSGIGVLIAALVLLAVIFASPVDAKVNKTNSEKALDYISQKHTIPKERLIIESEKEPNFPLSNQKILSVKILDPKTVESYIVNLDEAGNIIDIKVARELEHAKYREKYGKKEVALYDKLQKMKPDETVEVGIWLSPIAETPKPEREISEKEYNDMLDSKRKAHAEKEKPVLDKLKTKNINMRYASQYAPLIYASVPAKLMADVENIPEVEGIYLAREFQPMLDKVAQTERVQPLWNAGITGSGVKVAVVEHGKIQFPHSYLTQGNAYNSSANSSSHATEVAGIVASKHPIYQGISYGVPGLLSANAGFGDGDEARLIAASEWAISQGANILSNSWGNNTYLVFSGIDKYFDHVVWSEYKTVTAVAGNNIEGDNGNIMSPGLAYNVITVGGFEDKGTSDWSDDTMWGMGQNPGSPWRDPISPYSDREKPEVVAVASHTYWDSRITTLAPEGITQQRGTSLASPAVAAEAALLMQANSGLRSWPETVKAVIMASADHNIEGAPNLSEYDGAGGINISKAYEVVTNNNMAGDVVFASDFSSPKDYIFTVTSVNQKIRVAIAWASHPDSNHPPTNDTLQSNLDLYIMDPNNNVVNKSISEDNNYEIVEFTPATTGTFKARVVAPRFDGLYEYLGFAKATIETNSYLSGWDSRKQKTITGTSAGSQTNYQMKLTVFKGSGTDTPGTVYLGGNARDDFGDLRFTKSDGVTLLDYWIESYTPGVSATVWVEVGPIPASPNTASIYVYYGNPYATSASSGTSTFEFFDHFDSISGTWTCGPASNQYGSGSCSASNSAATVVGGTNTWWSLFSGGAASLSPPLSVEFFSKDIVVHPGGFIIGMASSQSVISPSYSVFFNGGPAALNGFASSNNGLISSEGSLNDLPLFSVVRIDVYDTKIDYYISGSLVHTKTTDVPTGGMKVFMAAAQPSSSISTDWVFTRRLAVPEPAWGN
ncbi:MAG: DUF2341 domain-containing protein [Candidatus Methanoperedens sp.]|nr:DUF2341 domain-containing protein [Candidatus Methanoperedens sp.]